MPLFFRAAILIADSLSLQFPNLEHLDFSDIADRKPAQEFNIPQGRDIGEYHVMYVVQLSL